MFQRSIVIVIGPTPPGTGVMAEATAAQEAKSASPQRRYPYGFVASGTRFTPTSITTAPGFSMSPVSVLGRPAATTTTSA